MVSIRLITNRRYLRSFNRLNLLIIIALFSVSFVASSRSSLILTGKIKAGVTQNFIVPWSRSWNHQIKWMKPEGELVEKGDLVVLFDTSSVSGQIEQQRGKLIQSEEKAKNSRLKLEIDIINAEHQLIKAQLEYNLAENEIEIPTTFRSNFEKDNFKFGFKKAVKNQAVAESKLEISKDLLLSDTKSQAIEVKKIRSELTRKESEIEQLQLKAKRAGVVLHALHPWNGSKITEGQSVQTSWKVAAIPGEGSEFVQSWVNEVDRPKIKEGQKVYLTLDAYPNEMFTGRVQTVSQQAESKQDWGKASYYDVHIEITVKSTNILIPGMSVRVEFPSQQTSKVDLIASIQDSVLPPVKTERRTN